MSENGRLSRAGMIQTALDRYEGPLLRYAHRLIGDADRAHDIVQEAFLRLCREDPAAMNGRLAPWLYTVCRNQAIDIRRKEQRMTTLADSTADATVSGEPPPPAVAEQHDESDRVARMLASLTANQQEVVRLKFEDGLSYREISEVTGLTVSNVGFLIHRAIAILRGKLSAEA